MLTRRIFLRGSAVVMAGMGSVPSWLARAATGQGAKRKTLVVIFQRGAADGLNIIVAAMTDGRPINTHVTGLGGTPLIDGAYSTDESPGVAMAVW